MTTKIIPNVLSYLKINSMIITRTQKILSLFLDLLNFAKHVHIFRGFIIWEIFHRYILDTTDSTFSVELKNKRHKAFFLKIIFNFVYYFLTYIFVVLWMRYGKKCIWINKKTLLTGDFFLVGQSSIRICYWKRLNPRK